MNPVHPEYRRQDKTQHERKNEDYAAMVFIIIVIVGAIFILALLS